MQKILALALFGLTAVVPITAVPVAAQTVAAEQTVTLAVKNMYCAACPHTVRASLEAVSGVAKVTVSYADKTAVVTYDDSRADVKAPKAATTNSGYPSGCEG